MNRTPILFRVDAGPSQGWESFYRCLAFGTALQRRRRTAYFLSQLEPGCLALLIKRAGNSWLDACAPAGSAEDLAELLSEIRRLRPAAVVLDSPAITEEYVLEVKKTGVVVASLDDLAANHCCSRLLVNPLLGPSLDAYTYGRGTQFLGGHRYAIVRPFIRRIRPTRSKEPAPPFRAMVVVGDDDRNNQAIAQAKLLLGCPKVARVDVVARPHHPNLEALQELAAKCAPGRLEIASENNDIPQRITRCHFALTAANSWSLELACVGVPQLVIVQDDKHWATAQRLEEEGAANCLGWYDTTSPQTVRQAVDCLLSDPLERQAMARSGRKLIDGRGLDRLVNGLEVALKPAQRVPLREAA